MKTLEERVAVLENANRRWRYGAALLLIVATAAAATKTNDTIADSTRTRRLEVLNGENAVIAEIANHAGGARMRLFDDAGIDRFSFEAANSGTATTMKNHDGVVFLTAVGFNGEGLLSVSSANSRNYANIGGGYVAVGRSPGGIQGDKVDDRKVRKLVDELEKRTCVKLGISDESDGYIDLQNREGKRAIRVFSSLPGMRGGGLMVINDEGKPTVFAYSSQSGGGVIDVYNSRGRKAVTVQADALDDGAVGTFHSNGEPGKSLVN